MEGCGWAGAMVVLIVFGDNVIILNILINVAVEWQYGPMGCRRCFAGTYDLAHGDDVSVAGGRVVEDDAEGEKDHVEHFLDILYLLASTGPQVPHVYQLKPVLSINKL